MQRPDHRFEVMRRHNAMGRARGKEAFIAGLPFATGSTSVWCMLKSH
jgi:hypothetical protein